MQLAPPVSLHPVPPRGFAHSGGIAIMLARFTLTQLAENLDAATEMIASYVFPESYSIARLLL